LKIITALSLITLSLAGGWIAGRMNRFWQAGGDIHTSHTTMTIQQVQALSSLVTTRVDVTDVLETQIAGRTGGMKVAIIVKGDFLVGVDLSRAGFESVDTSARTAVVVLPQPQTSSPRLDHERTKVFEVCESGLWQIAPGSGELSGILIDESYRQAQRRVVTTSKDSSLISCSRTRAEQVLRTCFEAAGWHVTVRWFSP
jgi:Protein of unknown function (DUF4230)